MLMTFPQDELRTARLVISAPDQFEKDQVIDACDYLAAFGGPIDVARAMLVRREVLEHPEPIGTPNPLIFFALAGLLVAGSILLFSFSAAILHMLGPCGAC